MLSEALKREKEVAQRQHEWEKARQQAFEKNKEQHCSRAYYGQFHERVNKALRSCDRSKDLKSLIGINHDKDYTECTQRAVLDTHEDLKEKYTKCINTEMPKKWFSHKDLGFFQDIVDPCGDDGYGLNFDCSWPSDYEGDNSYTPCYFGRRHW